MSETIAEFQPLEPILERAACQVQEAKNRISELSRDAQLIAYQKAFSTGKRVAAFLLAQALTREGVPPIFRHEQQISTSQNVNQKFDLFLYDIDWLRWTYPDHAKVVRYRRSAALLRGSPKTFHAEAEYMFYAGRRPYWKMVASLSLTLRQQHECMFLQSAPVAKQKEETRRLSKVVLQHLEENLAKVKITSSYSLSDLQNTLRRRHDIWKCYRMDREASLAGLALRYEQLTGEKISRQCIANQLAKMADSIKYAEMKKGDEMA
nr:hypothetical protein [Herbaspirillum sp. ASV7]